MFYDEAQIDVKANNPEQCDLGEPNENGEANVGICHATGSEQNSYNYMEASPNSAHFDRHEDDVIPAEYGGDYEGTITPEYCESLSTTTDSVSPVIP